MNLHCKIATGLAFLFASSESFLTPRWSLQATHNGFRINQSYRQCDHTSLEYSKEAIPSVIVQPSFEERMRSIVLRDQLSAKRTTSKASPISDSRYRSKVVPDVVKVSQSRMSPTRRIPDHVIEISSLTDFKDIVEGNSDNKVIAVRWFASWCRACRAVEPIFYGMVRPLRRQGIDQKVQFIDIPSSTKSVDCELNGGNKLHLGFEIPKVPYGHIYHPKYGLVEELTLNAKTANDFQLILKSWMDLSSPLPEEPNAETGIFDAPYKRSS
jgi:thiol-disulfide isomerase/thioredoxin